MSLLLEASRVAVLVNLGLLVALGYVWVSSYRSTRALYPLALSVFAALLVLQNAVWVYLYVVDSSYIYWFTSLEIGLQLALFSLCGLETLALVVLGYLTLR